MNHPLRVGLTGGIGSGKTTVSNMFEELGVPVVDADIISHDLTRNDGAAIKPIIELFGKDILSESGELRRDRLRKLVFNDVHAREQLESIIHPLVRQEIAHQINAVSHPYCLISIPLLLETGKYESFDLLLVVDCPEELQISRAQRRDHSTPVEIKKIIASQTDRQIRLDKADDIICNDKDFVSLQKQVSSLHEKYINIVQKD